MESFILCSSDPTFIQDSSILADKFSLYQCGDLAECVIKLLEYPSTIGVLLGPDTVKMPYLDFWAKNVSELNPFIKVVSFTELKDVEGKRLEGISNFSELGGWPELKHYFCEAGSNRRKEHRVDWPIEVHIQTTDNEIPIFVTEALSLSVSGVFLRINEFALFDRDDLSYELKFKAFSLKLTGSVARKQAEYENGFPRGVAIAFENVSDATIQVIRDIIDDRLIKNLFEPLKQEIREKAA